ncbi:O-antigen ligase family protein [Thiomicrorhabdus aquaedulcis]|uniref:O-antigen ligase family protein n=1 Tax=Thiomicrorhabdus aquaedulcis TaxID=2211106 RepID=UPI000FDB024B|nr:O-antigen ligase family protein [Thiomicrorhabdus aquaedulcis]
MLYRAIFAFIIFISLLYSQPNTGGSGLFMPNYVGVWFAAGLIILVTLQRVVSAKEFAVSWVGNVWGLAGLVIFGFALVNTATSFSQQMLFLGGIIGAWLFFYALMQWRITHALFLKILTLVCLLGVVHALVATVQLLDPFRVWYTLTGYLPFGVVTNRPVGIIQQVNMTATFMATVAVMALYVVSHASFGRYKWYWQAVVWLAVLLSGYILLLSGSRAGWLALLVALPLVLAVRFVALKKHPVRLMIWLALVVLAVLLALWFPGKASQIELLSDKLNDVAMGTDVRLFLYRTSWQLFLTSPWLGFGLDGYTPAFVAYAQTAGVPAAFSELKLHQFLHPHNEVLYWMLQSGVVALIGIGLMIAHYVYTLFKQRAQFALGVLALAIPMLIQTQLSSPFVFSAIHLFLLLFLLHYGVRNSKKRVRFKVGSNQVLVGRGLLTVLMLGWLGVAYWSVKSIQDVYQYEYRLFLTAKQTPEEIRDMHYFEYASYHPVFKDSVHGVMNKMLIKAIADNNRYDIQRFIWWAEAQAGQSRSSLTSKNLAKARTVLLK